MGDVTLTDGFERQRAFYDYLGCRAECPSSNCRKKLEVTPPGSAVLTLVINSQSPLQDENTLLKYPLAATELAFIIELNNEATIKRKQRRAAFMADYLAHNEKLKVNAAMEELHIGDETQ